MNNKWKKLYREENYLNNETKTSWPLLFRKTYPVLVSLLLNTSGYSNDFSSVVSFHFLYLYSFCSHLEHRASVKLFVSLHFLNLRQSVRLLRRGISPLQGVYLHRTTQTQNKRKHPYFEWESNQRSQFPPAQPLWSSCVVKWVIMSVSRLYISCTAEWLTNDEWLWNTYIFLWICNLIIILRGETRFLRNGST
jgi:hypothetical protein